MSLLKLQSTAMKEARKKWENELRAQLTENEREMQQLRSPQHKELKHVATDTVRKFSWYL